MAKKQTFNFKEFMQVSPSIPTLAMMLVSFFVSGMLLGIVQWAFGWIPFIGGFLTASLFFTLNVLVILLGVILIFLVEWLVSKDLSKAILAFIIFVIFDILPFNFVYPILLIGLKVFYPKK